MKSKILIAAILMIFSGCSKKEKENSSSYNSEPHFAPQEKPIALDADEQIRLDPPAPYSTTTVVLEEDQTLSSNLKTISTDDVYNNIAVFLFLYDQVTFLYGVISDDSSPKEYIRKDFSVKPRREADELLPEGAKGAVRASIIKRNRKKEDNYYKQLEVWEQAIAVEIQEFLIAISKDLSAPKRFKSTNISCALAMASRLFNEPHSAKHENFLILYSDLQEDTQNPCEFALGNINTYAINSMITDTPNINLKVDAYFQSFTGLNNYLKTLKQ